MKCLHFGLCQLVPLCLISASLAASSQPMDIAYLVPLPEKKEGSGIMVYGNGPLIHHMLGLALHTFYLI